MCVNQIGKQKTKKGEQYLFFVMSQVSVIRKEQ